MYRTRPEVGAHERSHTEAFFRRVKFWNDMQSSSSLLMNSSGMGSEFGSSGNGNVDAMGLGASAGAGAGATLAGVEQGGSGNPSDAATASGGGAIGTMKKKKKDPPPVFVMPDGMSYLHINRNGLLFACSTDKNVSPCTVIELLSRIAKVFKDYCGTLSEEAIRKNFILLYELLDEMIDYGYPQLTKTETLKSFVYNEPIVVAAVPNTGKMINPKTASANAVHKPVIGSVNDKGKSVNQNQKNEIFVDILERLNVIFNSSGYIVNSTIDGCIQMKSYLAGNPELRLALNEDLIIGKENAPTNAYGRVVLDDVSFHDCVNLTEFEHGRTLSFYPPDGEFVVLNYRLTGDYRTPFRIFPAVEETGPRSFEITVTVRAEMESSHFGANVVVELPLPHCTSSATCNMLSSKNVGSPAAEFVAADKKVLWSIKKFPGGTEQTLKVKVSLEKACTSQIRREIGPVNMNFEIFLNVQCIEFECEVFENCREYAWIFSLSLGEICDTKLLVCVQNVKRWETSHFFSIVTSNKS